MKNSSAATFASGFVGPVRESTMQNFIAHVRYLAAESSVYVLDTVVRLEFVKSGNVLYGYISTVQGINLEKGLIRECREYANRVQWVFATKSFGPSCKKRSSFLLVAGV